MAQIFWGEKKPQKEIRKIKIKDDETAEKLNSELEEHRNEVEEKNKTIAKKKITYDNTKKRNTLDANIVRDMDNKFKGIIILESQI